MAKSRKELDRLIEQTDELEAFLHTLLPALDPKALRQGDDVLKYAKKMKLKIPDVLRGQEVTWETGYSHAAQKRAGDSLVIVRPGHPEVLGLVIRCVRIGKWRFCLECGWLWCRIVVTRRF